MRWRAAAGKRSCAGDCTSATSIGPSRIFRKYGLLAVAIPSIMPPPVPFKIFILAAGAARVKPLDFLIAVIDRPRRPLLRRGLLWRLGTARPPSP